MQLTQIINKAAGYASLEASDSTFQNCFEHSLLALPQNVLSKIGQNFLSPELRAKLSKVFDVISFLLILGLIISTGLPQFANDKEGLALFVLASFICKSLSLILVPQKNLGQTSINFLILVFLSINIVAACSSHYLLPSIKGLAKLLIYVLAFFNFTSIFANSSTSSKRIYISLFTLMMVGLALSLYGFYQYKIGVAPLATWEDPTIAEKGTRIFATLGNPNLLAGYLIPLFPIAFALSAASATKSKWLISAFSLLSGLAITIAIFLTGSRGGLMGIFAIVAFVAFALVCLVFNKYPKFRPILFIGLLLLPVILGAAIHFIPTIEHRLTSIFAGREHSSNSYRLNVWTASYKMFLDSWWIGVGPGNQAFRLAYGLYMISGFDALGTYCVPLEILVECGIGGLLVFALIVIAAMSRAHLMFWQSIEASEKIMALGLSAAIFGMMVHGLVDTVFYRPQVQFIFWIVLASIICLRQISLQKLSLKDSR